MTAEEHYKLGIKPYCRTCEYCRHNTNIGYSMDTEYKNPVTKRKNKLRMKKNGYYCLHVKMCDAKGKPFKINANHIRWWHFPPSCPFNIYTHYCEACGSRMATNKKKCSSCKRNRELNSRGVL